MALKLKLIVNSTWEPSGPWPTVERVLANTAAMERRSTFRVVLGTGRDEPVAHDPGDLADPVERPVASVREV